MRSFAQLGVAAACAIGLAGGAAMADSPRPMSLLPEGLHHSVEPGFNIDNSRPLRRAIEDFTAQATAAGMSVKALELDWAEIEPREGRFELDGVRDQLETYRENGWQPLIFLRAVDSDDVTVPVWLKGSEDATALSEVDVSTPRFVEAYRALLDQVVPLVRAYGAPAILVANEPDNFLTPNPELTGQVVDFVVAARDHIHALDPDIAVGVALSNGFDHDDDAGVLRPPLPHHLALIEASDVAVFNIYCQQVPPARQADVFAARLQARIEAAGARDIILQELGCPSGGAPGLSESFQEGFFRAAYGAMEGTPVRISIVFQLVDWSEATVQFYGEALKPLFAAEPAFAENPDLIFVYLDQLRSIGLVSAEDGTPKPAWFVFLDAVRAARN